MTCPRNTLMIEFIVNSSIDRKYNKMRAVLQRVAKADITIDHAETRSIGEGLVVFLGVMEGDTKENAQYLAKKICDLRIFTDENDKLNLSLKDIGGDILIVSNFTLSADCRHGRSIFLR